MQLAVLNQRLGLLVGDTRSAQVSPELQLATRSAADGSLCLLLRRSSDSAHAIHMHTVHTYIRWIVTLSTVPQHRYPRHMAHMYMRYARLGLTV